MVRDLLLHQRLDLVRAGIADDGQADVVADELGQLLVLQDARKVLEKRRILRVVDVRLDLVARPRAQVAHQREQQAEQRQEILALGHLVGRRLHDALASVSLMVENGIAHHEDADGDAADDQELERLPEDVDVTALGEKAADQRASAKQKTEGEIQLTQRSASEPRDCFCPPESRRKACARLKSRAGQVRASPVG